MKIVLLERNTIGTDIEVDCFNELGDVVIYPNTVSEKEVAERTADADIVVCNKSPMNEKSLAKSSRLKLICELATGFDNCDLEYCSKRNIQVRNVVDYSTDMVAQHTFTLALALSQKLAYYDNYVKSGQYAAQSGFSYFAVPFYELKGKTWGIIGMGNIGKRVADIASAFGCNVIFHSITGKSTYTKYRQVDFDTLLKNSDFLSLHCPLSPITRNLIDEKELDKMKQTAILINVARGAVVNNGALYKALEEGKIAAAGLDVLEKEPILPDNPLNMIKDSSRLIITPHLAWASVEARKRCLSGVCGNIKDYFNNGTANIVNKL